MQFWLIEDGEKSGPFEDYAVREMIREGKLLGSDKVWYEGAEGWLSAKEVPVLQSEFAKMIEPPPIPEELLEKPPFLFWRRFGARWFDVSVYGLLILIIYRIGGISVMPDLEGTDPSLGKVFLRALPFILMEAALISHLGFTPGKWLMSLRVVKSDGQRLSTGPAIMRSLRVWVLGMGMGHILLFPIAHLIAFLMGKKKGAPLWDLPLGYRVEGPEPNSNRLVVFALVFFAVVMACLVVVGPELQEWTDEANRIQQGK